MAICEKSDFDEAYCAHCRNSKSIEEQADAEVAEMREALLARDSRWFASQYPGRCAKCDTPFPPGTLIRRGGGHELLPDSAYVAECCVTRAT